MFVESLSLILGFCLCGYAVYPFLRFESPYLPSIALNFASGMLMQFTLLLLFSDLRWAGLASLVLAMIGFGRLIQDCRRIRNFKFTFKSAQMGLFLTLLITLYSQALLFLPIADWDPSAIWFFAAKIIDNAKNIGLSAGWTHPSLRTYFHIDYPKLLPALAAGVMALHGSWDEFHPKIAFIFLLIPALLWIFSFYSQRASFLILISLSLFASGDYLWNGYLDAYLALYFMLIFLLGSRYEASKNPVDLYSLFAVVGIVSNLKNEGMVLCLCAGLGALPLIFLKIRSGWRGLIVLVPAVYWYALKSRWGLINDLNLSLLEGSSQKSSRLLDFHSWKTILDALFLKNHPLRDSVLILILVLAFAFFLFKKSCSSFRLTLRWILMTNALYFGALIFVYLSTPYELHWHLETSCGRTVLPLIASTQLAIYLVIKGLAKTAHLEQK